MTPRNGPRCLMFLLGVVACTVAQVPQKSTQNPGRTPQKMSLAEVSTVQVPSLPAESIGAPLMCDAERRIVFRLAMPDSGIEDPLSVSRDGKAITRFGREKISDIPQPVLLNAFLSDSDVYILTKGSIPLGNSIKLRKPNGEVITQPAAKSSMFVAHFEPDGR